MPDVPQLNFPRREHIRKNTFAFFSADMAARRRTKKTYINQFTQRAQQRRARRVQQDT